MTAFIEQVDMPESADPERAVRVGGSHAKLITLERPISSPTGRRGQAGHGGVFAPRSLCCFAPDQSSLLFLRKPPRPFSVEDLE